MEELGAGGGGEGERAFDIRRGQYTSSKPTLRIMILEYEPIRPHNYTPAHVSERVS